MFEESTNPLNLKLLQYASLNNSVEVKRLLKLGADPFVTVTTSSGLKVNVFTNTLSAGNPEIVNIFLQHTKEHGRKVVDLSQPLQGTNYGSTMNVIQYALLNSNRSCWVLLEEYYNQNNPSKPYSSVLNQRFTVYRAGFAYNQTLGHMLTIMITNRSVSSNSILFKNNTESEAVDDEFSSWLKSSGPNKNPPDLIIYRGAYRAFEYAISRGLDVSATNYQGISVCNAVNSMADCLSSPGKIAEFLNNLVTRGVSFKSYTTENRQVYFDVSLSNLSCDSNISAKFLFKLETLLELVENARKAQTAPVAPAVLHIHTKLNDHDQHLTRLDQATEQANKTAQEAKKLAEATAVKLNKHIVTFERTAAGIKEKAVDALRAYPEVYTDLFLGLYSDVESLLRQKKDAKLKVFTQNPSKEDRIAQTVLGVCSFALQASGTPFAALIPSGLEVLRSYRTELKNARTNKAVAEATVMVEPAALATMIALLITNQAMDKFGTDNSNPQILDQRSRLFAKVQSQVNKLGTTNVHDVEDAIAFLAMDAINLVNATSIAKVQDPVVLAFKSTNKSGSSSGSCSDDAPSLAAISDGSRTPPRNQTAVMAAALRKVQESQMQQNVRNTRTARSRGCVLQ